MLTTVAASAVSPGKEIKGALPWAPAIIDGSAGERRFRSCSLPWSQGLVPQVPDTAVGNILNVRCCSSSCCKRTLERGPLERAGFHIQQPIEAKEIWQRSMPSARRRHFCILLLPGKSMAAGGTQPAGVDVTQLSNHTVLRTKISLPSSLSTANSE